jgi:arginase
VPDPQTLECWNKLKSIGKIQPKVLPEDIVFIALRDYEKEEEYLLRTMNIKIIPVAEVRRKGVEQVVRQTMLHLAACDDIYISFDVDSLDSGISRGTGTPVSNGLREREAEDLLAALAQYHKICCFEVTEVNPTLDKENLMAEIAFNILQRTVNLLMQNVGGMNR